MHSGEQISQNITKHQVFDSPSGALELNITNFKVSGVWGSVAGAFCGSSNDVVGHISEQGRWGFSDLEIPLLLMSLSLFR